MCEATSRAEPGEARRPPRGFRPQPFAYHQVVEGRVETLTNQGQGLLRVPLEADDPGAGRGWVVMVPYVAPGERVRVRIYRNHRNYSEADLVEVLEASAQRVEPRCPLFGTCGGCQYQHLAMEAQLEWKRRQVEELLRHMAGVECVVRPVIASPRSYHYRAKITPHFDRPAAGEIGPIGFLRVGSRRQLVDVPQCPIATEAVNAALQGLREEVRARAAEFRRGATLLLREVADGRVATDPNERVVSRVGELEFEHLAGDFFQNNAFILPQFVEHAVEQARASGARHLVDAYCGSGLFALAAAPHFISVAGVEVSVSAVEQARRNAARNGAANATFLAASAEEIFAGIAFAPGESALIIDPPRAGCSEEFLRQMVTWRPRCCVYVSCNPATQMRDLRVLLAAGWRLQEVQPFDLFPQTKHLECVMTLIPPA